MKNRKAGTECSHIITSHGFHIRAYVYKKTSREVNLGFMCVTRFCYICQHLQVCGESSEMIGQRLLFRQTTRCYIA